MSSPAHWSFRGDRARRNGRVAGAVLGVLAVVLLSGAKRASEPSLLEQELRGWMIDRAVTNRVDLLRWEYGGRDRRFPNLFGRTEITTAGLVTYTARSILGFKLQPDYGDSAAWIPRNALLKVNAVEFHNEGISVHVGPPGGAEAVLVRLMLDKNFETRFRAHMILEYLERVLDFGPDLQELDRLAKRVRELEAEVGLHSEDQVGLSAVERLRALDRQLGLLDDLERARDDYSRLVKVNTAVEDASLRNALQARRVALKDTAANEAGSLLSREYPGLRERLDHLRADSSGRPAERHRLARALQSDLERFANALSEYARLVRRDVAADVPVQEALRHLSAMVAAGDAASERGCPRPAPLELAELASLVRIGAPDEIIASEIRRCGLAWEPDDEPDAEVQALGPQALGALRDPATPTALGWDQVGPLPEELDLMAPGERGERRRDVGRGQTHEPR